MEKWKIRLLGSVLMCLLSSTGSVAEQVWTICKGSVPALPSSEAMTQDVETGTQVLCSQEFTFSQWCDFDFNGLADELNQGGSLFLNAMNRRTASPDGSMSASADCSPGSICYLICTSSSAVIELAEESSDPPSTAASSSTASTPEQVEPSCSPYYYTTEAVVDGALFKYRQEFMMKQGVDADSDSLVCPCVYPCPYSGKDARHMKPGADAPALVTRPTDHSAFNLRGGAASVQAHGSDHVRSAGDSTSQALGCSKTLAGLANMTATEILSQFPHIGFMKPQPAARTMSHGDRAFEKFVIRRASFSKAAELLTLTSYLGQKLDIHARSGVVTFTHAVSKKTEALDGHTICIHNVPREIEHKRHRPPREPSMMQKHSCTGGDCKGDSSRFGGSLITSGSFTMSASGGA